MPDEPSFDEWLRVRIKARRMSQRQLAHLAGVDHSTISRLVAGERKPTLATATRLARVLSDPGDAADRSAAAFRRTSTRDPIAAVEQSLRADERLTDQDVRRIMEAYLGLRRTPGTRMMVRAVATAGAPAPAG